MGEMQIDLSAEPITFSIGNLVRDSADENPKQTGICKTLRARMGDQFPCVCVKVGDSRNVINKIKKEKDNIQMNSLTLGSLFDGIGGFPLAATRAGIKPVWSSEIEKVPMLITQKHFPDMKQLGDITKIDGSKIEPVNIITFGSPCQDLSLAGKRKGLGGSRSGLFLQAIRVIRQQRSLQGNKLRFILWENVPGAYSSNKGQDFRTVLSEIAETEIPMPSNGKWAEAGVVELPDRQIAWRTLDAQFWGVPQRRKRIFLVCDFGGRCAEQVLFECQSMSGNTAESKGKTQRVTGRIKTSSGDTGKSGLRLYENHPNDSRVTRSFSVCPTINSRYGTGGGNIPFVLNKTYQKVIGALCAEDAKYVGNQYVTQDKCIITPNYRVRRLTPLECERLQGYPDYWTDGYADTSRYKALGNSVAIPCVQFIISRMAAILKE